MKFAVDYRLANMNPNKMGMGEAISLEYNTIKNKFGSVHTELAEIGITEVKVTDHGLQFAGYYKNRYSSRDLMNRFEKIKEDQPSCRSNTNLGQPKDMDVNITLPVTDLILRFGRTSLGRANLIFPNISLASSVMR